MNSGMLLVVFVQSKVVDHCVFVCGSRGVIVDLGERYHLGLSAKSLRLFGGPVERKWKVAEVRETL